MIGGFFGKLALSTLVLSSAGYAGYEVFWGHGIHSNSTLLKSYDWDKYHRVKCATLGISAALKGETSPGPDILDCGFKCSELTK
ncbi:hypothetical protein MHLP_01550 [Candidatus Mycoplasma haematolamae str. Purdue]|uniref:Uncharacterized protein n=1 Tax=Mycoplasma haematolamae (strain Purdue) TaxID=1212765 RepID=I7B9D6_MYCHA|nr:hypothetical protein [Candidatus Mycoplasma haematolamae]AFO51890.1 hypothetical protein MHLP_01550 [Candidatus Mycoplasma haematolamae str. Purdue]